MMTLAAIESQIQTARNLSSIVGTMRTLAMVNIRRFERTTLNLRQYTRTIHLALHMTTRELPPNKWRLDNDPKHCGGVAVLIGSDQGLCGPFNDRILKYGQALWSSPDWSLIVVGERLAQTLVASKAKISAVLNTPVSIEAITTQARELLYLIEEKRQAGACPRLEVMFNSYVSQLRYEESSVTLLPFSPRPFRNVPPDESPFRTIPQLDKEASVMLLDLLPQYFLSQLALALAESTASENAARLAAMEGANRNIDERLDDLMDQHRQRRQEEITTELADVLVGAEALEEGK